VANKFIVSDNQSCFHDEEVVIQFRRDERNGRFWVMSYQDVVDLQTSITTYLAGERLG
jgi:hypothetical protein